MDEHSPLHGFAGDWARYLERHGHSVKGVSGAPHMLLSRNGRRKRYRWLLRCVEGDSLLLTPVQRKEIRREVRLGRNANERTYIVVKFDEPVTKVVVMPATEAIKAKRLSSDKGGIPWHY